MLPPHRSSKIVPVRFTIEKEYRPSFKKILKSQRKGLQKQDHLIQMDPGISALAAKQVLLRLNEVSVLKWKSTLGLGKEADIDVVTVVVDDANKPLTLELKSFPKVKRGEKLSIGKFGVQMYQESGRIPTFLDMRILVARNKQGVRDVGQALKQISESQDLQGATNVLSSLISGPIGTLTSQVDTILGIIGTILGIQKDDQLLYYATTVHRDFDNLGIGKHCDGTEYVEFCYSIQVGNTVTDIR